MEQAVEHPVLSVQDVAVDVGDLTGAEVIKPRRCHCNEANMSSSSRRHWRRRSHRPATSWPRFEPCEGRGEGGLTVSKLVHGSPFHIDTANVICNGASSTGLHSDEHQDIAGEMLKALWSSWWRSTTLSSSASAMALRSLAHKTGLSERSPIMTRGSIPP